MKQRRKVHHVEDRIKQVRELLLAENREGLLGLIDELHPVELAGVVGGLDFELRQELIQNITGLDQLSGLISYSSEAVRDEIISRLDDARIAAVIRRQELDDAADLLRDLSRKRQKTILRRITPLLAKQLTKLLTYGAETAGGIMTPLFLSFPAVQTAAEVIETLRKKLKEEEVDPDTDITYIYVVDDNASLLGVTSLRELLSVEAETPLKSLMNTEIITVFPEDDQEHVARLISAYDFTSIPVVDHESHKLLGIVTIDDVLDVIEDEYTEDLLLMAGTEEQDIIGAPVGVALRSRIPWLLTSWFGGMAGAMLLGSYSSTLEKVVALAFFMPVVFGMGGNVGTQSSTITVRGIATGELSRHRVSGRLRKEALVGLSLGATFGLMLGGAAYMFYRELSLSLIVGISICITMTCSASMGSMLPVIFKRMGFDPAVASGPLITTSTDILSICIYFTVATMLL